MIFCYIVIIQVTTLEKGGMAHRNIGKKKALLLRERERERERQRQRQRETERERERERESRNEKLEKRKQVPQGNNDASRLID